MLEQETAMEAIRAGVSPLVLERHFDRPKELSEKTQVSTSVLKFLAKRWGINLQWKPEDASRL